jgi:hypothetical protein
MIMRSDKNKSKTRRKNSMDDLLKHCLARLMALAGATVVLLALATPRAQAQITTLHSFTGPTTDGSIPLAGLP